MVGNYQKSFWMKLYKNAECEIITKTVSDEANIVFKSMVRGLALRPKESSLGHWLQSVKGTSGDDALTRRLLLLVSRH